MLAGQLPALAGQVCNLPDGRVQLLVRGPKDDVADLVGRLRETFSAEIRDIKQFQFPPGEDPLPAELSGVEITHHC
jgi:acylphosphatase